MWIPRTRRQAIVERLAMESLTLEDLKEEFSVDDDVILEDLNHIALSILSKRRGRLVMDAASCRCCGFMFRHRMKRSTPSRCPKCNSEKIIPPSFRIVHQ